MSDSLKQYYDQVERQIAAANNTKAMLDILGEMITIGDFQQSRYGCSVQRNVALGTFEVRWYYLAGLTRSCETTLFSIMPKSDSELKKFVVIDADVSSSKKTELEFRDFIRWFLKLDGKEYMIKARTPTMEL